MLNLQHDLFATCLARLIPETPKPHPIYTLPSIPRHAFFFDLAADRVALALSLFAYISFVKGL